MRNSILKSTAVLLLWGAAAPSNAVPLPYTQDFASGLGDMTVKNVLDNSPTFITSPYGGYSYGPGIVYVGSSEYTADDYITSPVIQVKAGNVYTVSVMYKNDAYGVKHNLEILGGKTPDNLTDKIVNKTEIQYGYSFSTLTGTFTATEDGDYYVSLHLIGDAAKGSVYFDEFKISAGVSAQSPSEVTDFAATANIENDEFVINLSCKAPSLNYAGSPLEGTMTVKAVRNDGTEIYTAENIQPGADITFKDTNPLATTATYTIKATNTSGEGPETSTTVTPNFVAPKAVTKVDAALDGSTFTITWDAVTEPSTVNGLFIPSKVTYKVQRNIGTEKVIVAEDLTTTSYTYKHEMPAEGQDNISFSVIACFMEKTSAATSSKSILAGTPYTNGFAESFSKYSYQTKTWTVKDKTTQWGPSASSSYSPTCEAQDGDNGILKCQNTSLENIWIASPYINVEGMKNPRLDFYVYQDNSLTYTNAIQTNIRVNGVDTPLGEPIALNGGEKGWNKFSFYLPEEAKSGNFQIVFDALPGSYASVCIDNIIIKDVVDNNLAIEALNIPEKTGIGKTIKLEALVTNKGSKPADKYFVEFSLNGKPIDKVAGTTLNSEEQTTVIYPFTITPQMKEAEWEFSAKVIFEADEVEADNSLSSKVFVESNKYPTPESLQNTADKESMSINLSWTAPQISTETEQTQVNEDFETWTAGSIVGENGWTFVDVDGVDAYGINSVNSKAPMAALVVENVPYYTAHSGTKMLGVSRPYNYSDKPDEWIISPEVIGGQTIKFYSVAYSRWGYPSYEDEFTVCYSTGGTEPADFTQIGEVNKIKSSSWVEYTVELPLDATRFAINVPNIGNDGILFDDFSFIQGTKPLVLKGYNIYRNGELLFTVDENTTTYTDKNIELDADYVYTVSAIYDRGESVESASSSAKIERIAAPEATEFTNFTATGFTANWNKVEKATKYLVSVYTKTDNERNYIHQDVETTELSHEFTGLDTNNNIYYYVVKACEGTIVSLESAEVKVEALLQPQLDEAVQTNTAEFKVSWEAVANALYYEVSAYVADAQSADGEEPKPFFREKVENATSVIITIPEEAYDRQIGYKVRAVKEVWNEEGTQCEYFVYSPYAEGTFVHSATAIEGIGSNGSAITMTADGLSIANPDNKPVKVYDASGVLVYSSKGNPTENITLNGHGLYIVKIGDQVFKLMK